MMDLSQQFLEWDMLSLNLGGLSDWSLFLYCNWEWCQKFEEGSRVLLATMTFKVEDTMTICLDTCRWQPLDEVHFLRSDGVHYIPRDNMPYCFSIFFPVVGDVNADGLVSFADLLYMINYLYKGGPAPYPLATGDCNCDECVDLGDMLYLISYLYRGGPPPGCS